jgi:pyrroline-5-carboxylate reductase
MRSLGFPRDTALRLVTATIRGSASYAMQSSETLATLRNNVTSPGGTTASALYQVRLEQTF